MSGGRRGRGDPEGRNTSVAGRAGSPRAHADEGLENWEERRRSWCMEAYRALTHDGTGKLSAKRLRGRVFASWLRALIADMVASGVMPASKVVRTNRIIGLLVARAESGPVGALTSEEFIAFTRVVMRPSPGHPLEEEIAWALLDVERAGVIPASRFVEAKQLWTALGVYCSDQDVEKLIKSANDEDGGMVDARRYHELFMSCYPQKPWRPNQGEPFAHDWGGSDNLYERSGAARTHSLRGYSSAPASARGGSAPPMPQEWQKPLRQPLFLRNPLKTKDQILRSREVAELSLVTPRHDACDVPRPLTPSRPAQPKRPGRELREALHAQASKHKSVGEQGTDASGARPSRLPRMPVKPKVETDWELQEACWSRRQARFVPYQRVQVQYIGADGKQVNAAGTLLSGWDFANTAVKIPHSRPPESDRFPRAESPRLAAIHEASSKVVVEVNGVEKVVPRECVSALDSS